MRRQRFVWYFIIFCFILFNLSTYVGSQDVTKPKIVISIDLEGVAHVVGQASGPGSYYYDEARELLTKEINAAIEGCLEAGAGEIVVADNHGNSLAVIPEKLHEAAKLARGWPRPLDLSTGIDENTIAISMVTAFAIAAVAGSLGGVIGGALWRRRAKGEDSTLGIIPANGEESA